MILRFRVRFAKSLDIRSYPMYLNHWNIEPRVSGLKNPGAEPINMV